MEFSYFSMEACCGYLLEATWVKVFKIVPYFRILWLTVPIWNIGKIVIQDEKINEI